MRIRTLLLAVTVLLASCSKGAAPVETPSARGQQTTGDIVIGVGAPFTGDLAQFGEAINNGATMAVDEINAAGGVLGRKIKLEKGDDQAKPNEGALVAQRFVGNSAMVAVVGHFNSGVSIPASVIYHNAGILMMSPGSTNPALTQQGFSRVFRNLPNDDENGRQLAEFAARKGFKKVAIYFANNAYGKGLANVFEKKANESRIEIVDRQAYDPERDEDFRAVLTNWKKLSLDAICIAGETPKAAVIIAQAREAGITAPFLGGDGLASSELWDLGGAAAEGTFVTSYFHPSDPRPEVAAFRAEYLKRHNREPEVWAAQAYDAIKVIAAAIEKSGSAVPDKIAEGLRNLEGWNGVTGLHKFDDKGDVVGKKVIVTVVRNKNFELYSE